MDWPTISYPIRLIFGLEERGFLRIFYEDQEGRTRCESIPGGWIHKVIFTAGPSEIVYQHITHPPKGKGMFRQPGWEEWQLKEVRINRQHQVAGTSRGA